MRLLMYLTVLVMIPLLVAGCLALKDTVRGIKDDPGAFQQEASEITGALQVIGGPVMPVALPVLVGIGYRVAFLRRLYVNWRKQEAEE